LKKGSCEKIGEKPPHPSLSRQGERVKTLKYKKKFPPPRRGRARVGAIRRFFHTFRGRKGDFWGFLAFWDFIFHKADL
jgi:hypothetical protein